MSWTFWVRWSPVQPKWYNIYFSFDTLRGLQASVSIWLHVMAGYGRASDSDDHVLNANVYFAK